MYLVFSIFAQNLYQKSALFLVQGEVVYRNDKPAKTQETRQKN
ncbi:hypothetical protein [Olivibacter jilunii]